MIKLRKSSPEDLNQILEINKSAFLQPWPKSEFEKFYQKYPDGFIVAKDEEKIAGFALGKISGNQGTIKLIAVSPDYRGKGIGKNLMDYVLKYFTEQKIKEVTARSRSSNEVGCAFLKSFDFDITETVKSYYLNGDDAFLMKKK